MQTVREMFDGIMNSRVFRRDGADIDLCAELTAIANAIDADESDGWMSMGASHGYSCSDLIAGAYWSMTQWHKGQWSDGYIAMCALGRIYDPGRSSEPSEGDPARDVMTAIDNYMSA